MLLRGCAQLIAWTERGQTAPGLYVELLKSSTSGQQRPDSRQIIASEDFSVGPKAASCGAAKLVIRLARGRWPKALAAHPGRRHVEIRTLHYQCPYLQA